MPGVVRPPSHLSRRFALRFRCRRHIRITRGTESIAVERRRRSSAGLLERPAHSHSYSLPPGPSFVQGILLLVLPTTSERF